jgi:hypothetical protein
MNTCRAGWAEVALLAFCNETGCDLEDALTDLLGDLMHWADRNDTDERCSFPLALRRARNHYREETERRGTQSANFD